MDKHEQTHQPDVEVTHDVDRLVVITGMSGAGRTEAMHIFEDLGYFCIDNLPPRLLLSLVTSGNLPQSQEQSRKLAVVCDVRSYEFFRELIDELDHLRKAGLDCRILFLDANDQVLLARYKASRRRHPMCTDNQTTIAQGIQRERELLIELREVSNVVIDTSSIRPIELRSTIRETFTDEQSINGLGVVVYSFGFKHGAALDADIVIDVRFLPNPYYDPDLRHLTGLDDEIRAFVMNRPETKEFLENWENLLACIMKGYVAEGKQQLAIAVGCTGGQHRSVTLAQATGDYLKSLGYRVHVSHRDLSQADTGKEER